MSTKPLPEVQVLHSWKEISSYMGRGVRTLQRYEVNLGFPVHRPLGKPRSSVLAFKHEIDEWLAKTPAKAIREMDDLPGTQSEPRLRGTTDRLKTLCSSTEKWHSKTLSIQQGVTSMQQAIESMQQRVKVMLQGLERTQTLVAKSRLLWEETEHRRQRVRMRVPMNNPQEALHSASASGD